MHGWHILGCLCGYLALMSSGEDAAGEETKGSVLAGSVNLGFCAMLVVPGSMS